MVLVLLTLSACNLNKDSIRITADDYLSSIPAGAWIDSFDITYNSDLCIKKQIIDGLDINGDIIIDYVVDEIAP